MNQKAKVISAFAGVFTAGAVCGGFFTLGAVNRQQAATVAVATPAGTPPVTVTTATPPADTTTDGKAPAPRSQPVVRNISPSLMRTYARRLNLTDQQRATIQPVIASAEDELRRLRTQNLQETTRVMNRMYTDISQTLTEEQRTELDGLKRSLQERMEEERRKMKEENGAKKDETGAPTKPPS